MKRSGLWIAVLVLILGLTGSGWGQSVQEIEQKEKEELLKQQEYEKLKLLKEEELQYKKDLLMKLEKEKAVQEEEAARGKKILREKEEREGQLKETEEEIAQLKDKLRARMIVRRRVILQQELKRLIALRERLLRELEEVPPPPPGPKIIVVKPEPEPPIAPRKAGPEVGLAAGLFASIPAVMGEVRYHDPFQLVSTCARLGAIYAQGEDMDKAMRKHALVFVDGIYRLNPPGTPGINSYFGLGVNYNAYTTGRKSGSVGGQAYYGMEGNTGSGKLYLEIGYGLLQTGFSPDYKGLGAMLGYRI